MSGVDYNVYMNLSLIASEPWPTSCIFIQQESPVFINYHIAGNSTGTQHQFSTRQYLYVLNAHGVYQLPQIETPGMTPALRLLINDTTGNNMTEILCLLLSLIFSW